MRGRLKPYPGVTCFTDAWGKRRYRLRRTIKGRKVDCYLPGEFGTPAFETAYAEALEGVRPTKRREQRAGTFDHLFMSYLASPGFKSLRRSTQDAKRRRLEWLRDGLGAVLYRNITPANVEAIMAKKGDAHAAANRVRKDLIQLYDYASKRLGHAGPNPAKLADPIKIKSDGFHTWNDAEILKYRSAHASGTKARLAFELGLNAGVALSDVVRLTRKNLEGGVFTYTRKKTDVAANFPIAPELAVELDRIPKDQFMLLLSGKEKPFTTSGFTQAFARWCAQADLPATPRTPPYHGLRKALGRRLAEAGASDKAIAAFLGHATTGQVQTYTRDADRSDLTRDAAVLLENKTGSNVVQAFVQAPVKND